MVSRRSPSHQAPSMEAELHQPLCCCPQLHMASRGLRRQTEHIAARFPEFTTDCVVARCLDAAGHRMDAHAADSADWYVGCALWASRPWRLNSPEWYPRW